MTGQVTIKAQANNYSQIIATDSEHWLNNIKLLTLAIMSNPYIIGYHVIHH